MRRVSFCSFLHVLTALGGFSAHRRSPPVTISETRNNQECQECSGLARNVPNHRGFTEGFPVRYPIIPLSSPGRAEQLCAESSSILHTFGLLGGSTRLISLIILPSEPRASARTHRRTACTRGVGRGVVGGPWYTQGVVGCSIPGWYTWEYIPGWYTWEYIPGWYIPGMPPWVGVYTRHASLGGCIPGAHTRVVYTRCTYPGGVHLEINTGGER